MTQFVKVTEVDNLPDGERLFFDLEEETAVIFNIGGSFFAIADLCSHDDGPLEDGDLEGFTIECPRHGACFDVRSGAALSLPATAPIPSYQVKVEDGFIWIEDPDL